MSDFDPTKYQEGTNGPLKAELVARLFDIKNRKGISYAALSKPSGLSGAFYHHLMNKKGNVSTQHVEKIVNAVEQLEGGTPAGKNAAGSCAVVSHAFHLRPDLQVTLQLPNDLSEKEADRLAKFISALPIA